MDKVDIEVRHYPNGYERMIINGKDLTGKPKEYGGISAADVIHYMVWWFGYEDMIKFVTHYVDENDVPVYSLPIKGESTGDPRESVRIEREYANQRDSI